MSEAPGPLARPNRVLQGLPPVTDATPRVTLPEGDTPLIPSVAIGPASLPGKLRLWFKYEGLNPTGSFKDRGMTMAISKAAEAGAKAAICASTGNTSAGGGGLRRPRGDALRRPADPGGLRRAGEARPGPGPRRADPPGRRQLRRLPRAGAQGDRRLPGRARQLVNPYRMDGQKTAAFEIVDALGQAPDLHCLPVGNAGNITAYWWGYKDYRADGVVADAPRMWGFQAAGAAPLVSGEPVPHPETIATAIRIGNPASWHQAIEARDESGGIIDAVTDDEILAAYHPVAARGAVLRARQRRQRRRPAQAARCRRPRSRSGGRLHADRQRPEGHALGARVRTRAGGRAHRRRGGRARPGPGLAMSAVRRDAARVVVPATSANLGPAFDSAGLALAIYDELIAMVTDDDGILVEIAGEGEGRLPLDESHLVVRSMRAAFDAMGADVPGFVLRCANAIPHGRGLGSSAAAIIGGIVLARALVVDGRERMTDGDVLQLALRQGRIPTTSLLRSTEDSRSPGSRTTGSPMPCAWIRIPTSTPSSWSRRRSCRRRRRVPCSRRRCPSPTRRTTCPGRRCSCTR